jgi:CelD/BcsL family acetyltransferase involved in cellulose biosynthesis
VRIAASVRPGVEIAIAEEGGDAKAFFPFERHRRVGKPVGGVASDCQAVIAAQGWTWDANALVRGAGLYGFEFTNLRVDQRPFTEFHRAVVDSPVIGLERGFDTYAAERHKCGSNVIRRTDANARRLARRVGPLRLVLHDRNPHSLHRVIEWKRQQYRATGARDHFLDRSIRELVEKTYATQTEAFAGMLSTLWAGERMVAGHFGMRWSSTLHSWLPAYDPALAQLAPGRVLLLEICRRAPGAGIHTIELGEGPEDYKRRFANGAFLVASGCVGAPSLALRARHFGASAKAVARRLGIIGALRPLLRRVGVIPRPDGGCKEQEAGIGP